MDGLKAQGLKPPETARGIRNIVVAFGNSLKDELRNSIAKKVEAGERFSLSLDEWTSKRNRRYMALNLHQNTSIQGLGMVRIDGSMPAEKAKDIVETKLADFGLSLKKHIVGTTTDGASVMKKMGRLMQVTHQLCHAHGIHLAVVHVLYKMTPSIEVDENDGASSDEDDEEDEDLIEEERRTKLD
jgi:hypothetical protein